MQNLIHNDMRPHFSNTGLDITVTANLQWRHKALLLPLEISTGFYTNRPFLC